MLTDDGMINEMVEGTWVSKPGRVLAGWLAIRKLIGSVPKEKKPGMKFATIDNVNVIDKVSQAANDEGILIYPVKTEGQAHPIDDGTLADVNITFRVQSVHDGSFIHIAGFGEGADSQDKAGGKAGTYAMKQALVQALLAAGTKPGRVKTPDTDDTDEPIPGGVKRTSKPKSMQPEEVSALFDLAQDSVEYASAMVQARLLQPGDQVKISTNIRSAKERITNPTPKEN